MIYDSWKLRSESDIVWWFVKNGGYDDKEEFVNGVTMRVVIDFVWRTIVFTCTQPHRHHFFRAKSKTWDGDLMDWKLRSWGLKNSVTVTTRCDTHKNTYANAAPQFFKSANERKNDREARTHHNKYYFLSTFIASCMFEINEVFGSGRSNRCIWANAPKSGK